MYIFTSPAALLGVFSAARLVETHALGQFFSPSLTGAEINIHLQDGTEGFIEHERHLEKRQACGSGIGSCPPGQCCSTGGQCGTESAFCIGPQCQLSYGPSCDGNTAPPGASTQNIPRTKMGNVPYGGTGVYHCTVPGTIALTFDDGPFTYTQSILDVLAKNNVQATFFINGNSLGKGRIDDPSKPWPQVLRNMHNAGHQLASHTWTHQDLSSIPPNLMQNQIVYNEMAFRNIFGFFPTYIRPPYGLCASNPACSEYLNSMGYHIVYWDVDTRDYLNDDASLIQKSKNYFAGNISDHAGTHSYIPLAHDNHQQTALVLIQYMLDTLKLRGYKAVTVGECMGDLRANWYREAPGGPSSSTLMTKSSSSTNPNIPKSTTSITDSSKDTSTIAASAKVPQTVVSAAATTIVAPVASTPTMSAKSGCGRLRISSSLLSFIPVSYAISTIASLG